MTVEPHIAAKRRAEYQLGRPRPVELNGWQRQVVRELLFARVAELQAEVGALPGLLKSGRSRALSRRQRLEAEADRLRRLAELFLD